jgi:hypothetical protein
VPALIAPAAALACKGFDSPTGNIGCIMDSHGVRCDIRDHEWRSPPKPKWCEVDYGGATLVGTYVTEGENGSEAISFGYRFSTNLKQGFVNANPDPHCLGTVSEPTADPGYFCMYQLEGNVLAAMIHLRDLGSKVDGRTGLTGVEIYDEFNNGYSAGTWAATAP